MPLSQNDESGEYSPRYRNEKVSNYQPYFIFDDPVPLDSASCSALTPEEGLEELRNYTCKIRKGLKALAEIIEPLQIIKSKKLYQYAVDPEGNRLYPTFEDYLNAELGMVKSTFSKLTSGILAIKEIGMNASPEVKEKLKTVSADTAYALSRLPEDRRAEAAEELIREGGDTKLTAKKVRDWGRKNTSKAENTKSIEKEVFNDKLEKLRELLDDSFARLVAQKQEYFEFFYDTINSFNDDVNNYRPESEAEYE